MRIERVAAIEKNSDINNLYSKEIEHFAEEISDEHYRNIIGSAIHKLDLIHALRSSPYGLTGPLAYTGGLVAHVYYSLKMAATIADQLNDLEISLNKSLIISSCILRNIGWHTTTLLDEHKVRPRDAFYMTGINRASMRYIDHLIISVESDLQIKIPEAKKQALENSCDDIENIKTIEGKIVANIDSINNMIHFSDNFIHPIKSGDNWYNDIFIGHMK